MRNRHYVAEVKERNKKIAVKAPVKPVTKTAKILKYLKTHKRGITQAIATEQFKAYRLGSIIFELRKTHNIKTTMIYKTDENGVNTRYAVYTLN